MPTSSPEALDLSTVPLLLCLGSSSQRQVKWKIRSGAVLPAVFTVSLLSKATHPTGRPLGNSEKGLEGRLYVDDLKSLGSMTLVAFTVLKLQLDRRNSSRCWIAQSGVSEKN